MPVAPGSVFCPDAGSSPVRAFLAVIWIFAGAVPTLAGDAQDGALSLEELSTLSLEELLDVNIQAPAVLTRLDLEETPASLTSLTSEDILRTPARNILDLIEIYVPGAIWMNSEEGPLVGMRGSIRGRNTNYLLIVNGKQLNSKSGYGAKSELELWDLGDIKRLDIIRGPGSVTYGPSAVAGVIRITTHDAASLPRTRLSAAYVHEYDSKGASLSHGSSFKDSDFLVYGSLRRTQGYSPLNYQGSNNNQPGYLGIDIAGVPLDYFADYQDIPQAKAYVEFRLFKHWNLWARYTQQGSTWSGNEAKTFYDGKWLNQQSLRDRQYSASLEYRREWTPRLDVQAEAGVMLFDAERRIENPRGATADSPQNFRYNFSESEYLLATRFNYRPVGWLEAALGAEAALESTGPGWGDSPDYFRTGGDGVIVSGPESPILGPNLAPEDAYFAGDGWSTRTFSVYVEAQTKAASLPTLLLSGRADKNTNSQWLLSPRAAVIARLPHEQMVKAIVQRSAHRNESGELYIEDVNGTTPSYETLLSYELIHQARIRKRAQSSLSLFYNDADVLAWDPAVDRTLPIGNLELIGFEAEIAWEILEGRWGANYSLVQQIDWNLAPGTRSSGISYADYDQPLRNSQSVQSSYGEDLNNWPNQSLKLFGNFPIAKDLVLHGDAQIFWDYQGAKDGLAALQRAGEGDSLEADLADALRKVRDEGTYGMIGRLNLSLQYAPTSRIRLGAYVFNLLGTSANQRHSLDVGNMRFSPSRVRFIREERAAGLTAWYSL